MTAQLPQDVMELIADLLDYELVPQVYVLERPDQPWRPLLRDDPVDLIGPAVRPDDDPWDIL